MFEGLTLLAIEAKNDVFNHFSVPQIIIFKFNYNYFIYLLNFTSSF